MYSISELLENKEGWVPVMICFWKNKLFHLFSKIWVKQHFSIESTVSYFTKSLLSLEAETMALFTTEKREVSSANDLTLLVRPRGTSLM